MYNKRLIHSDSSFVFSPSQLKTEFLPLLSVIFVSENSLVAAVRQRHTVAHFCA